MGKWVGGGWSWWPGAGSSWTFSPYIQGDDNPNLPPPKVAEKATRGPAYYSTSDGHRYRTWQVPSPNGRTTQIIVD